jgi:hypothetical protein
LNDLLGKAEPEVVFPRRAGWVTVPRKFSKQFVTWIEAVVSITCRFAVFQGI